MMMSGSGTRSAVSMIVDMKLIELFLLALFHWWPHWKERTRTRLIRAIELAAGAQHLLFQRRDAGDVDQDPVHEGRRQRRRKAPGIQGRQRDHGVGEPAKPFEEIVRVARPAPQANVADPALLAGFWRKDLSCASAMPSPAIPASRISAPQRSRHPSPAAGTCAATKIAKTSGIEPKAWFCRNRNIRRLEWTPHFSAKAA